MPYDVATTGLLEDALSEAFQYHNELDTFLLRAGLSQSVLSDARSRAEARAQVSTRGFGKAPKRFVVQEVLAILADGGSGADGILASMITGLCKGAFRNASTAGEEAIQGLRAKIAADRTDRDREKEAAAAEAANREAAARREREAARRQLEEQREALRQRFLTLMQEQDPQRRGYQLEPFMNDLFELEGLDPRRSFKIIGEQIDGSMLWRSRTNLVEVKWVSKRIAGLEFGAFTFKIEGKTADTRGLFIAINGYSPEAIRALNGKGALKFICLDGAHIMRALGPGQSLKEVLEQAWRHADETGEAYLPVAKMSSR